MRARKSPPLAATSAGAGNKLCISNINIKSFNIKGLCTAFVSLFFSEPGDLEYRKLVDQWLKK